MDQAIIFCRTKLDCDNLENFLKSNGTGGSAAMLDEYSCTCVHGDRSSAQRRQNLQNFKDGDVRFLICTDVAARGIDIRGVPFVINMTLPDEKENYIHRIGRVGRADRMGLAISLVSSVKEKVWYCGQSCKTKGPRGCRQTSMLDKGGCAIWYDEPTLLQDVESHLGITIESVDADLRIPSSEFDGKVVYGEKRNNGGNTYQGHADILRPDVLKLSALEKQVCTLNASSLSVSLLTRSFYYTH